MAAEPGKSQQRHEAGERGQLDVVADVEEAVGGVRIGADLEAAAVGGAHLHRKDDGGEVLRLLPVKGGTDREALAGVGEDAQGRRGKERLALLGGPCGPAVRGVQRDGGIQAKREGLHEGRAVDAAHLHVVCAAAHELGQRGLDIVSCHAQRAGVVVAGAEGDDPQLGAGLARKGHEAADHLVDHHDDPSGKRGRGPLDPVR